MESLPPFDPSDPSVVADPYPHYARYREREPVHVAATRSPIFPRQWFLFRHADVASALRDPRLGRDWHRVAPGRSRAAELPEPLRGLVAMVDAWLLFVDPPRHGELRAPLADAFRPRALAPLERFVDERAAALLRAALAAGEAFDVIADFALPLTSGAIAELFGFGEDDRSGLLAAFRKLEPVFGGARERLGAAALAAQELRERFGAAIYRSTRGLLSRFAATRGAEREQAISTAIFVFGAGFATTVHGIANGVLALARHPDQCARLRADATLLPSAVEEVLRFDPPVQRSQRFALEPLELGGRAIPKSALVTPVLGSANRDPEVFPDPDRFDVARDARAQLGFGGGIHFCLGAALARLEMRCALRTLLARMPRLELVDEPLSIREGAARGPRRLRLRV